MIFGSWVMYFDLGNMFLNFALLQSLRTYVGIRMKNLGDLIKLIEGHCLIWTWKSWVHYFMGFTGSLFCNVKTYYHTEEFVIGNPTEPRSQVWWDRVIVNYIGIPLFNPHLPIIMK